MNTMTRIAALATFGWAMVPGWVGDAGAQNAPFYAGKTLTIVVGFGVGGGYDLYARLAADHLGKHIPGNPTVLVQNMPGGGGRRSIVYIAGAAPKDGTSISLIPQAIAFDSVLGEIPGNVDAASFNLIGRLSTNVELQVTWHTSATKSFEDAKRRETVTAATGATGISSFVPRTMNALLQTKFKVVDGYQGSAEMALAVERGEAEGMVQTWAGLQSTHPQWLSERRLNLLWQIGTSRHPELPDVPAIVELAQTPEQLSALKLIAGTADIGRSLAAPPGVPAERVQILRAGFDAMVKDAAFLADAKRRNLPIEPASGEEVQALVASAMATPESVLKTVRKILTGT